MPSPKSRLVVVGSRLQAYREYAMASLAREHELMLVTSPAASWEKPHISDFRTADTTDPAALRAAVGELLSAGSGEVETGIFTWDELSLTATATVAAELGLPHMSVRAAAACRDKYTARGLLDRAGLPGVRHRLVHSVEEAGAAAREIGYPVVLKARSLAGSMGVARARDAEELAGAYETAAGVTFPGLRKAPGVLLEEFLTGPEISVDSCVENGEAVPVVVARKRLGFDPAFEEVGHLVAPWRHERWAEDVTRLVRAAHRALDITLGMTHTEIRLTPAGPRLIEINGRLGGGLIPYLGALATGVDPVSAAGALALGRSPALAASRDRCAEIRFLYPPHDGVLERLELSLIH
ncbi:ATP-grasp domain-containing protein, partial [Streptomyces alkaliphilus]